MGDATVEQLNEQELCRARSNRPELVAQVDAAVKGGAALLFPCGLLRQLYADHPFTVREIRAGERNELVVGRVVHHLVPGNA